MMQALFRIAEPEEGSSVLIDGVDTKTLGLDLLRSQLTIISQESVMVGNINNFPIFSAINLFMNPLVLWNP